MSKNSRKVVSLRSAKPEASASTAASKSNAVRHRADPWNDFRSAISRMTDRSADSMFDAGWMHARFADLRDEQDQERNAEVELFDWLASRCPELRTEDPQLRAIFIEAGINRVPPPDKWVASNIVGMQQRLLKAIFHAVRDPAAERVAMALLGRLLRLMPDPEHRAQARLLMAASAAQAGQMEAVAVHTAVACRLAPSAWVAREAGRISEVAAMRHEAIQTYSAMMRIRIDDDVPQANAHEKAFG